MLIFVLAGSLAGLNINFSTLMLSTFVLFVAYLLLHARKYRRADWGHALINVLDGVNRLFCYKYHRLNPDLIQFPSTGGGILASNHVSGLDPLLLAAASPRPLRFMIAREQYDRFALRWFFRAIGCIPVEREARPEKAFREALRALHSGEILAIFPHGKIHLDNDPPRQIKGGVVKLAELSGCKIFPARLEGIRGQRQLVMSVPKRSNVSITLFKPIAPSRDKANQHIEQIAACIEGRVQRNN